MLKHLSSAPLLTTIVVISLTQGTAFAQTIKQDEALNLVHATSVLAYWQKAPMSLMMYCSKSYPSTAQHVQGEYIKWQKINTETSLQVDKTLSMFSPLIGKYMKKTPDQLQVYMTKSTDEEVITPLEKNFTPAERAAHCGNFGNLLTQMLSDDLVKPRVTLAIETLRSYERRLPALLAQPNFR